MSDNYIRIADVTINVSKATSHAIQTNDAVYIDSGTLNLTATKDGIQCEAGQIYINDGTININAGDDGITSSYDDDSSINANLTINGGTIIINAVAEGLEAKRILTITAEVSTSRLRMTPSTLGKPFTSTEGRLLLTQQAMMLLIRTENLELLAELSL